ncbi:EamA family transporter [Microlunatus parietis]|uniref:Inner membrane transporter RhtA n=1 Tax=Microlunatus parietis TaxID=682979 RepID=A0A7Y9LEI9_9ACTN|nr:DMT family transporter [Microlunatus parietis]NYE73096.1 inner membrane transporter RhtA [Microlunatus parietis]
MVTSAEPLGEADPQGRLDRVAGRVPAVWLVLIGIVSVQFGAAIAKNLFPVISPTSMVWLRLTSSAVLLLIMVRPRLRGRSRTDWLLVTGFGITLLVMNWAIYQSMARIPIGVAVTIEFLGPLAVAVIMSRRARDLAWVILAGAGVAILGFSPAGLNLPGVGFALLAGLCWACYILLSARTGRSWSGLSGLAVASTIGTIGLTPFAIAESGPGLLQPQVLILGVAVGLMSSVIPYSLEMLALRRIPPGVFGILMSLEPGVAALAGMIMLAEFLSVTQWIALACVVIASVGATRTRRAADPPPVD